MDCIDNRRSIFAMECACENMTKPASPRGGSVFRAWGYPTPSFPRGTQDTDPQALGQQRRAVAQGARRPAAGAADLVEARSSEERLLKTLDITLSGDKVRNYRCQRRLSVWIMRNHEFLASVQATDLQANRRVPQANGTFAVFWGLLPYTYKRKTRFYTLKPSLHAWSQPPKTQRIYRKS